MVVLPLHWLHVEGASLGGWREAAWQLLLRALLHLAPQAVTARRLLILHVHADTLSTRIGLDK